MARQLTLLVLVLACWMAAPGGSRLVAQGKAFPSFSIEARYLGPYKTIIGSTRSIPPHMISRIDGYDYQLEVKLMTNERTPFRDSLYGVVCIFPDRTVMRYYLEEYRPVSSIGYEYTYELPLRIVANGKYTFVLALRTELVSGLEPLRYSDYVNRIDLDLLNR